MLKAINIKNTFTFLKFCIDLWLYHWYNEAFVLGKADEDGKNKTITGQGRKQKKRYMMNQRDALHALWGKTDFCILEEC